MRSSLIFGDALVAVQQNHVARRNNSGNQGRGRLVVTSGEIDDNDEHLVVKIWNKEEF